MNTLAEPSRASREPVASPRADRCLLLVERTNGVKLRGAERCPNERLPGFALCAHHVGETVNAYRRLTNDPGGEP